MSGGNLSPRQQMIGLMYLVLLAMLAMNASKDLLNAFVFLENGIDVTTHNFNDANRSIYNKINSSAALGSDIAIKTKKNSDQILASSNKIFSLLDKYKNDIIELGGGFDPETNIPLGKDDANVGAEYLLVGGNGGILKKELLDYKTMLGSFIDTRDTSMLTSLNALLNTPDFVDYEKNTIPWENNISEYLPLAAVTANLTNLQSYVRNAESQVLNYMYEEINMDTYKVNKIMATSIAESGYILQGDKYSANIFLAAADTTQEPIVIVGDYDTAVYNRSGQIKFISTTDTLPVDGGIGNYKVNTEITGNHAWGGIMKVPHPNPKRKGEFLVYPFVNNYTVAAPSAVISSDQLNIMYKGLKNEMSVSAAGLKADQVKVSATNCRVTDRGNGKYYFEPTRAGRIQITISTKINGEDKILSAQTWKSTLLPKPQIEISGVKNNKISKKALATILERFGAKAKYDKSFPISTQPKIETAKFESNSQGTLKPGKMDKNGKISTNVAKQIARLPRNSSVTVYMKVRGLDKIPHNISRTITIK
jgi:gliding motility-associated protein GldM